MPGDVSLEIAQARRDLGRSWVKKGYFNKGIEYLEKSLKPFLKLYGENGDVLEILTYSGLAWSGKGDNNKVLEYFERSLVISKKLGLSKWTQYLEQVKKQMKNTEEMPPKKVELISTKKLSLL